MKISKKNIFQIGFVVILFLASQQTQAQSTDGTNNASTEVKAKKPKKEKKKKEKDTTGIKTGWTFGALPSVAYDADKGFQYGLLGSVYYYGDGSTYPEYLHYIYAEAAYTTKRSGIFRLFYDSKYLIPKHRLTIDVSYLPDAMCDFLGYNGFQSVYNDDWRNSKAKDSTHYKSRAFYKFKRDIFRATADIQGKIQGNWYWNVGIGVLGYNVGSVDLESLNKGKKDEKKLPDDIDGLYEKYLTWGIIKKNEESGGWHPYLRAGFTYDTRDKQSNPSKGIHADAFFTYSAAFKDQKEYNNLVLNATFRHYVPIYKDYVSFAYRVGTQLLVAGKSPFYQNGYMNTLFVQRSLYEGLGGSSSLRGIIRNRILADGYVYANIEFRLKVWKFKIARQNFYIGFNPLFDIGILVQPKKIKEGDILAAIQKNDPTFDMRTVNQYFDFNKSIYSPHMAAGIGLKIAMNENFILSVDWAVPFSEQDRAGFANLYIKMGYLF